MFKKSLVVLVMIVYIVTYYIWSRAAIQQSQIYGFECQYFFVPEPSWQWRMKNYFVVIMYYPLISIDHNFSIACEPSWQLQRGD